MGGGTKAGTGDDVRSEITRWLARHLYVGSVLFASAWVWVKPGNLFSFSGLVLITSAGLLGGWAACVINYLKFATHASLDERYVVTYTWRPILGAIVGVLVTVLIVGGVLTFTPLDAPPKEDSTVLFLTGIAALTGLFSKRATWKMNEIARVIFARSENDTDEPSTPTGSGPGAPGEHGSKSGQ